MQRKSRRLAQLNWTLHDGNDLLIGPQRSARQERKCDVKTEPSPAGRMVDERP
jgi:hypothetical protein